eukprot:TRINITY_DN6658_c0_g1_i2.p1 TRINITY_DN6658_c0_g1~~TRINITY_DN6658_c0_g1_i2.p1  ORF type:complete len:1904 (-),score=336.36 TRINITY_DN6658_c0_g1_i2:1383-7094(-)
MLSGRSADENASSKDPLLGSDNDESLVSKSFAQRAEETAFATFYTLNRYRVPRFYWSYMAIFVEHAQILSLMLSQEFVWSSHISWLQSFLKIFGAYPSSHAYSAFLLYFWATPVFAIALFVLLYKVVKRIHSDSRGDCFLYRLTMFALNFASIFLFVPAVYMYVSLFNCVDDPEQLEIVNDNVIKCWDQRHIIFIVLSSPFYVPLGIIIIATQLLNFESTPNTKHLVARQHARIDFISCILKIAIVVILVHFDHMRWLQFLAFSVWGLLRFIAVLYFQPYYQMHINNLMTGLSFCMFFAAICLGINMLLPHEDKVVAALLLYIGLLPFYKLGYRCVEIRNRVLCTTILSSQLDTASYQRYSLYTPSKVSLSKRFWSRWEELFHLVELPSDTIIVTRILFREDMNFHAQKKPSKEAIEHVDMLFAEALETFPESSTLIVSYMGFLIYQAKLMDKYRIHAEKTRELQPLMDIRYLIYQKSREIEEMRQISSSGTSLDLSSYIEFQTNYKEARKYHAQAIRAMRRFWHLLLMDQERFDVNMLPLAAEKVTQATGQAQRHYENVIKKHPEAPRLLRAYAEFILGTSQDQRKANMFLKRAEELEEKQARSNGEGGADAHGGGLIDMNDKSKAVITIDGKGMIQTVNQGCVKLFLYSRGELMGSNVKMLMPSPYSENHDTYLANYHRTGIKKVLGNSRTLDGKSKKGEIIPVRLSVHQTDVNGQVFFVGIIERLEDSNSIITATVDGTVLSCNEMFTSKLEISSKELVGQNIGKFFSPDPSEDSMRVIQDFESFIAGRDTIRMYICKADGNFVQVILSPNRQTQNDMAYYRCSVEFLDDIEVNISINETGVILSCNHFIRHVFGYAREEVIGKKINTLMPLPYAYFHDTYLKTYMTTGVKNVIGQSRIVEGQHVDGSRFKVALLVSECEIDGAKAFSARISFAKKTEIPCCRLTVGKDGLIRSHNEEAVNIIASTAEMIGQPLSQFIRFVAKGLRGMDILEILSSQMSQGTVYAFLSQHSLDTGGTEVDVSIDILPQEVGNESVYIVRIFLVHESDVTMQVAKDGTITQFNDLAPHLFGLPGPHLKGKNLFELLESQHEVTIQVGAPSEKEETSNGLDVLKHINQRTKMLAMHRDGSHINVFTEIAESEDGYFCRMARKKTRSGPFLKSRLGLVSRGNAPGSRLLGIEDSHWTEGSKSTLSPGSQKLDLSPTGGSARNMQLEPSSPMQKQKPKLEIGDRTSELDSSEGTSSYAVGGQTGVKRIQRIRSQVQRRVANDQSILTLQRHIMIALFLLVVASLAMFATIYIIAGNHVTLSYSVALCGNSIGFHHSIYSLVEYLNFTTTTNSSISGLSSNSFENYGYEMDCLYGDSIMLEHSLMALYMDEDINDVYKKTLDYVNKNKVLAPYEASNVASERFLSDKIREIYSDMNVDIVEVADGQTISSKATFIRSMKTYLYYARFLANATNWDDRLAKRYIYFILNNGPKALAESWEDLMKEYHQESDFSYELILIIENSTIAVAVFSVIVLGIYVIRPGFALVYQEKQTALGLFTYIPKTVVRSLSRIQMQTDSSDSDAEAADMLDGLDEFEEDFKSHGNDQTAMKRKASMAHPPSIRSPQHSFTNRHRRSKDASKTSLISSAISEDSGDSASSKGTISRRLSAIRFKITIWSETLSQQLSAFRLRKETKKWMMALIFICIGFASVTIYGNIENLRSQQKASLVYHASSFLGYSELLAYQSLLSVEGEAKRMLVGGDITDTLGEYNLLLQCITQGCDEHKIWRSDRKTEQADLFYSNRCFLLDKNECPANSSIYHDLSTSGLVNVANEVGRSVQALVHKPTSDRLQDEDFLLVWENQRSLLRKGIMQSVSIFVDDAHQNLVEIQRYKSISCCPRASKLMKSSLKPLGNEEGM